MFRGAISAPWGSSLKSGVTVVALARKTLPAPSAKKFLNPEVSSISSSFIKCSYWPYSGLLNSQVLTQKRPRRLLARRSTRTWAKWFSSWSSSKIQSSLNNLKLSDACQKHVIRKMTWKTDNKKIYAFYICILKSSRHKSGFCRQRSGWSRDRSV